MEDRVVVTPWQRRRGGWEVYVWGGAWEGSGSTISALFFLWVVVTQMFTLWLLVDGIYVWYTIHYDYYIL